MAQIHVNASISNWKFGSGLFNKLQTGLKIRYENLVDFEVVLCPQLGHGFK